MAPISAHNTSNRCLWSQRSHRVESPSCVSIRSSSSPWAAATSHIQMYPSLSGLFRLRLSRRIGTASICTRPVVTFEYVTCNGAITYNHNTPPT
ncbi:uncharacterized protein LACBIDRAFT_309854 [Laccaria bicolor S238N-H82]|uniref:Predicted protein n=1 Tax=Laccaria bicolor (strain S238N-H82 / ATCC MYA-4686) TaxID=486041 RepID=B0DT71_LACBS|nr:uncharacterized protein LACBIDRAFT_309854 [Laccaria bicolor S238N-H82]EDR02226.1 predicted protein [Laccaria bicolor S238N-H82]|eukprot:XP_001887171.1 predicted protein [Laccaria bicolor S238N-H82]